MRSPLADSCIAVNDLRVANAYSITSSARASSDGRHVEAEHPGGLGVDDQFELGRLHDRQVRRLCALEDAADIDADLTIGIRKLVP